MEKKSLVIVIILLLICTLGLGGYIIYDKVIKEDSDSVIQNKDNNNTKEMTCSNCVTKIEDLYDKKETIQKNILFNNSIKELKYESTNDNYRITVDNNEIYNESQAYPIVAIYILGEETLMIVTSGVGISPYSYLVFDKNLNKVDANLSIDNGDMMEDNMQVENNKIIISGTRYRGDKASIIYNGETVVLCDDNSNFIGQDYLNVVLKAEYEINYLGDSKFSSPEKTKDISYVNESVCK